ncbi:hypothetical protein Tco_1256659, partial [Tanacetum coccineum]
PVHNNTLNKLLSKLLQHLDNLNVYGSSTSHGSTSHGPSGGPVAYHSGLYGYYASSLAQPIGVPLGFSYQPTQPDSSGHMDTSGQATVLPYAFTTGTLYDPASGAWNFDTAEVKKIDHSAAVLASIQSQVLTVVEKYVGTKIHDALLKALERHTADLVEKYSLLLAPESSKKQESEKSPKEIIRIKREQGEKKPEPMYTIKSTDKAALEEFDLKGALFNIMHKNKSANRNPANYRLYHALMEALIEDENAMDKEVADKVKDHKRKRDSDDDEDDDDEGPSAGSNQGESTKRRRHDSSASGSAQPPSKDSEQSTKNKLDSNRTDLYSHFFSLANH